MPRVLSSAPLALLLAALAAGVGSDAHAHRVEHEVVESSAVVVFLRYADGSPFSFEECEIRRADTGVVVLLGHTDAFGRLAFVPPAPALYTVRALAEDGHGATFDLDTTTLSAAMPAIVVSRDRSRGVLQIASGVAVILALFAGLRRFGRGSPQEMARRDPSSPSPR